MRESFKLSVKKTLSKNLRSTKVAFTLAEILMTIGIIGAVAALTMPTLMQNYQKKVWVNALKKDYAMLSQGFRTMIAAEGVSRFEETDFFTEYKAALDNGVSAETESEIHTKYINKYFKSFKSVAYPDQIDYPAGNKIIYGEQCTKWAGKGSTWYVLNDTTGKRRCRGLRQEIYRMANGNLVRFGLFPNTYANAENAQGKLKHIVGDLAVDINGSAPPNQFGKDAFNFVLGQDGNLYPYYGIEYVRYAVALGYDFDKYYWKSKEDVACGTDKTVNSIGEGCAARIMEENWEITYF